MTQYTVSNETGIREFLQVDAETDLGYHVRISVPETDREYRDFIPRNLFESLLKAGILEPLLAEAQAG